MRLTLPLLTAKLPKEILPNTQIKIFRRQQPNKPKSTVKEEATKHQENPTLGTEYRENPLKIQMLSKSLYEQIFKSNNDNVEQIDLETIKRCQQDFLNRGIKPEQTPRIEDVKLKLPPLKGENIEEHFHIIADEQCQPYRQLIESLIKQKVPSVPTQWQLKPGWTYYDFNANNEPISVECPQDDAIVFDIEVCMHEGQGPTLACALGATGWYSWTSPHLCNESQMKSAKQKYSLDDLIPLESSSSSSNQPKLIVGHNVSYDRARIREQYKVECSRTRFLDTMSLHVCVSGVTSYQRAMLKSKSKTLTDEDLQWSSMSSLNSLAEVYKLYTGGLELSKEQRNLFVDGELSDIRANFQSLMDYCAKDVQATHTVLLHLYPMFSKRFPHPATLAGMLELGMAYLPINKNWQRYINESNLTYEDLNIEAKYLLEKRANQACRLAHNDAYRRDLWMWDQDWSCQTLKFKKTASRKDKSNDAMDEKPFCHLHKMADLLPIRRPLLPGYPEWYRKLCNKPTEIDWKPGPQNIGTGMQVTPKLLSLCWEGYPLHFIRGQGWGFLVPHKNDIENEEDDVGKVSVPLRELVQKCPVLETKIPSASKRESDDEFNTLRRTVEQNLSKRDFYSRAKCDKTYGLYTGTGVWCNVELDECCWFFKLPHKDGVTHRVGNPLARDFLNKFSENVLSGDGAAAEKVIKIARMLSYWRNNRDRIMGQMTVWSNENFGAIIPQVVVCGTLTRRAMEPTWMTASNAQTERVGSELRAMVQAPDGYRLVGADVDSQELWIASVLGDAKATRMHGATPLGWMTLSGTKSDATDMHSVTAKAVGISRDHAKVINYARIYGAGQVFAERLLKQFNPTISDGETKSKAMKMFAMTKGRRIYYLQTEYKSNDGFLLDKPYTKYEASKIAAVHGKTLGEMFAKPRWEGGTESAMFNRLEEIAEMNEPVTPFLQCRLSRALEPQPDNEDRFLPTRINWVVQSGAVDFLHLMLVCMRWLMDGNIRFCLSFHDEVRYLVPEKYAYRAALAMHVTNLLTRSFCAKRIGLSDLPQSVAFFSTVEVDTVLRKDSNMDCATPSNPHGLTGGYGINSGESLNITKAIELAGGGDLSKWEWHQVSLNNSITNLKL